MKQAKKPTLAQKKIISLKGLRWPNWLVIDETDDSLIVRNKISNHTRALRKK